MATSWRRISTWSSQVRSEPLLDTGKCADDLLLQRMVAAVDDEFPGDDNIADAARRHAEDYIGEQIFRAASCDGGLGEIDGEEVGGLAPTARVPVSRCSDRRPDRWHIEEQRGGLRRAAVEYGALQMESRRFDSSSRALLQCVSLGVAIGAESDGDPASISCRRENAVSEVAFGGWACGYGDLAGPGGSRRAAEVDGMDGGEVGCKQLQVVEQLKGRRRHTLRGGICFGRAAPRRACAQADDAMCAQAAIFEEVFSGTARRLWGAMPNVTVAAARLT